MEDIQQQLREIFQKTEWSAEDRSWLLTYLEQNDTTTLQRIMQEYFAEGLETPGKWKNKEAEELLLRIKKQIGQTGRVVRFTFWKRAVAAAIVLMLAAGAYLILSKKEKENPVAKNPEIKGTPDIAPGGNKAMLTLADGSTIVLDSAGNGVISEQGKTKVIKLDNGQILYAASGASTEMLYNTVSTPRGGQYQLTLADGTKVWLNAASSLRYPATFTGKERKVELTGEGYFEVAKNASMPFKVNIAGKGEVEVLGTHFNINAYNDEATINTTLLEGLVKVSTTGSGLSAQGSRLLSPGQQAQLSPAGEIRIQSSPDLDEVMAWKNGNFSFEGATIQTIMRQLSRWYDVDVSYEGKISSETFTALVSRNNNISQLLKIMEAGGVKFKMEGKKITVM